MAGLTVLGGVAGFAYLRRRTGRARSAWPVLQRTPLLIAHRGGAGLAPENTLPAFRAAVERWSADMIELDVRATADGRCVVIHDATVDRTTDGSGPVADMTWEALQSLDAGYRFSDDAGSSYPFRGRDVRVPSIEEVLEALPGVAFTIEVKEGAAQAALLRAIARAGAEDRIVLAGQYDRDRTLFDDFPGAISASGEQVRRFYVLHRLRLGGIHRLAADVVQVPEHHDGRRVVSQRFIRNLHRQGVQVHVWTVDEEVDMERLLAWGVDGIVTDRPDRLRRILASHTDASGGAHGRP